MPSADFRAANGKLEARGRSPDGGAAKQNPFDVMAAALPWLAFLLYCFHRELKPWKPSGKAAKARVDLEDAILEYLEGKPDGAINNQIARDLGLESDFNGRQKNYLTYSILGGLMTRGLIKREIVGGKKPFKSNGG